MRASQFCPRLFCFIEFLLVAALSPLALAEYEAGKELVILPIEVIVHPSFTSALESQDPDYISGWMEALFAKTSAIAYRDSINVVYRPVAVTLLSEDPISEQATQKICYSLEFDTWYVNTLGPPAHFPVFFSSELREGGIVSGDHCEDDPPREFQPRGNCEYLKRAFAIGSVLIAAPPASRGLEVLLAAELANSFHIPDEHWFCPNSQNNGEPSFPGGPINTCAPSACVPNPDHHQTGGVTGYGYCSQYVASHCPQSVSTLNKPERFCDYFRQQLDEVGWCLPREPVSTGFAESEPCVEDADTACLNAGGRYAVSVSWRDHFGNTGAGKAKRLPLAAGGFSEDSGYFTFFDQGNVELVVKVLDGRTLNDHFWVFYGSLTDVEFTLEVVDSLTGRVKYYTNLARQMASEADTSAFMQVVPVTVSSTELHVASAPASALAEASTETFLNLNQNRFKVEVDWTDPRSGDSGAGQAVPLTGDSGYFWFFHPSNAELIVKVLEACPVNGHRWVFYGSLTDVEFRLRVTDLVTGKERVYDNPGFDMASDADTAAFSCH